MQALLTMKQALQQRPLLAAETAVNDSTWSHTKSPNFRAARVIVRPVKDRVMRYVPSPQISKEKGTAPTCKVQYQCSEECMNLSLARQPLIKSPHI